MRLKLPSLEIKRFINAAPRHYWDLLLIFFFVVLIGTLAFDGWVFWRYVLVREEKAQFVTTPKIGTVRKGVLENISARMDQKEKALEQSSERAKIEDPS
jgi:hypothetical protein